MLSAFSTPDGFTESPRQIPDLHAMRTRDAFATASTRCARLRCGMSYMTPLIPTTPTPGAAAKAATIASASATAFAVGG